MEREFMTTNKQKVVVIGGGVGGMSAAHELIQRGFDVAVYELRGIPSGKARSIPFPNSGTGGRKDLPGEHGFRFFPRFYKHLPDTMKNIPFGNNRQGVFTNLVQGSRVEFARLDQSPFVVLSRFPRSLGDFEVIIQDMFGSHPDFKSGELKFFAKRLYQLLTSCVDRRIAEYEKISWWDYIQAENKSVAYQKYLAEGLSHSLVAAKARVANAMTIGNVQTALMLNIITPGSSADRVLNGPTDEAWVYPWLSYLEKSGVDFQLNAEVKALNFADGKIQGITVEQNGSTTEVNGDYYVSGLPVEVMSRYITAEMLEADPALENINTLAPDVAWMNGMQFYITEDITVTNGHSLYVDSKWALTSISQKQFWPQIDMSRYGDGTVRDILSVDISDWNTPGTYVNKAAKDCSVAEIKQEVWENIKHSLLDEDGNTQFTDEMLNSYFLDPDIIIPHDGRPHQDVNLEPLLINKPGTLKIRPEAATGIPNLFLASDYVRTTTDLACMEAANEAARRAVNAILEQSGSSARPCKLFELYEPELFALFRHHDQKRFDEGLPWDGMP